MGTELLATGTRVPRETQRRTKPPPIHSAPSGTHPLPQIGGGASLSKMISRGSEQPAVLLITR